MCFGFMNILPNQVERLKKYPFFAVYCLVFCTDRKNCLTGLKSLYLSFTGNL
jgi:hypothetical protein